MNELFKSLDKNKQIKIMNAAIDEFVKYGFDKASTNSIVKQADIAKGSLFNYFDSKKTLFLYLIDYSIQIIDQLYDDIDLSERDLFKRLENIGFQKIKIQSKYPNIFDFLKMVNMEKSSIVQSMIQKRFESVTNRGLDKIYEQIDYTKFRDDIDIKKAIEVLNWTMFGFSDRALKEIDSFNHIDQFGEKYLSDWREYADFLKNLYYK